MTSLYKAVSPDIKINKICIRKEWYEELAELIKAWFVRGKRKQIIKGMKQLIYGIPDLPVRVCLSASVLAQAGTQTGIANIGAGYEQKNGLINI